MYILVLRHLFPVDTQPPKSQACFPPPHLGYLASAYSWKPESLLSASPVRGWTRNPGFSQVPGGFERRFFVVKLCEQLEVTMVKFQAPEGSRNRGIIMFVVLPELGAPPCWWRGPGKVESWPAPRPQKKHRRHLKQQPEAPWGLFPR